MEINEISQDIILDIFQPLSMMLVSMTVIIIIMVMIKNIGKSYDYTYESKPKKKYKLSEIFIYISDYFNEWYRQNLLKFLRERKEYEEKLKKERGNKNV